MKFQHALLVLAATAVVSSTMAKPSAHASSPNHAVDPTRPALLPLPQEIKWVNESIPLEKVKVTFPVKRTDRLKDMQLKKELKQLLKSNKLTQAADAEQQILFRLGKVDVPGDWKGQEKEAYNLTVGTNDVVISANTTAGLYYGLQTLRQLMVHKDGKTTVAACSIHDYPAFKIRGFMHDVGRNFQSLEQLRMQIDTFAAYKINTFHFHLTEYHGWRLESKIYPRLQADSSFTRKPGKFYTQKEFKKFVDYCWARNITIIPEFDTPGHSDAFRKGVGVKNMKDPKALKAMVELFDELCSLVSKEKMPYIHIGTDEASKGHERVNSDYLPALHKVIQDNDRDVIGWIHGMHIKGDTRQIQQTWASSNPIGGMRQIDSRSNYLNYLQALNFATRMHFQQPCRVPHGDDINLGGILCYWPDTKVDDEKQGLLNSPVLSAIVGYSEAVWKGVAKDQNEYWCKIPARDTADFKAYADFEERIIEQRDRFMDGKPFLALRTHNMDWRLLGPVADGEVAELEKGIIKDHYERHQWSTPVHGATINIRHFFKFPSHISSYPKGKDIVWANTYIYSDKDQTVDAWIDFNTIASSGYKGGEKIRPQGQWGQQAACNIWINGKRIEPPAWESKHQGYEHALNNEIYSARPPSRIKLKKGWNTVLVKACRSYKWVFSFRPIHVDKQGNIREVEGLEFSTTRSRKAAHVTPLHTATTPVDRFNVGWWKQRHEQKLAAARDADCDLLFVGDSITQGWDGPGKNVWEEFYGSRKAFNIGYSGDQTQHVLWRLDNGEMADFKPKVAVVMIGTNNTGLQPDWTARGVADGVLAIIDRIHAKSPDTKVLLLSIFPRGATPEDRLRIRNDEINAIISTYHDGDKVHYLDLDSTFLDDDGILGRDVMPDLLHPHAHGYKLWAEAMNPTLKKLLRRR